MWVTTKGRYGLRLMMDLAERHGQGLVSGEEVARRLEISVKYIHVIANSLKAAGLLRATRGPSGGYELARPPELIHALDVVRALDGSTQTAACQGNPAACARAGLCATQDVWCELAAAVERVLSAHSLADLARRQRELRSADPSWEI